MWSRMRLLVNKSSNDSISDPSRVVNVDEDVVTEVVEGSGGVESASGEESDRGAKSRAMLFHKTTPTPLLYNVYLR